jgi:hypothetical protein
VAFLGLAQADAQGSLTVSKFGPRLAGASGFINISQNAMKVVFVGTFSTSGLEVAMEDGALHIRSKGRTPKFMEQVEHVTYSGAVALQRGQEALYVTERCVFRLTPQGLELTEIAPGIDLERDILERMAFRPAIAQPLKSMDEAIFQPQPMGLRETMLRLPLGQRFAFDAEQSLFFANFEGITVRSAGAAPVGPGLQGACAGGLRQFLGAAQRARCLHGHGARRRLQTLLTRRALHHQRLPAGQAWRSLAGARLRASHLRKCSRRATTPALT